MIQSFADRTTAAIFSGLEVRRIPPALQQRTAEKLALLDAAHVVEDLRVPPGNRLEKLSGDRIGHTADTALRLARYFGTTPQFWMNLQRNYDLRRTEATIGARIRAEIEARPVVA